MKINRRQFIQSVMAAAVVANVPFTEAEAEAAYESIGIQDMGNGWYRCAITYEKGSGFETFSIHGKADKSNWMTMSSGRVQACFDLETGEVGQVTVCEETDPKIGMEDGSIWWPQLETVPLPESWTSAQKARYFLQKGGE